MKKTKKLSLSTERIRNLTDDESKAVAGGWSRTCTQDYQGCGPSGTCTSCNCPPQSFTSCLAC